jgi:hypothetical protein
MTRQPRFILSRLAQNYYEEFFFFFLLVMAFSVPTSRLVMSMSQIALASLWVLDTRYREKFGLFFQNKVALILSSLFVLHLLGLFYTNDFDAAFKDLRIKLPLLLLPLLFSSVTSFSKQKTRWVLLAFSAGVLYSSLFVSTEQWFLGEDIKTILSDRFIKHMRFSLSINLAIFSLFLLLITEWRNAWQRVLAVLILLWLFVFMLKMGALSAYVIFSLLFVFLLIYVLSQSSGKTFFFSAISLFIALSVASYFLLFLVEPSFLKGDTIEIIPLDKKTSQGNNYSHKPRSLKENGKHIYQYVCEKELKKQWNQRSEQPFYGTDKKGQELKATLIRYLTSLNLRKDSLGLSQLSTQDILHVENGIANVNYTTKSEFEVRLMQLAFELEQIKNSSSPDGYSLAQRREYWKVSWHMIKKSWLFGSGTGDNRAKMQEGYQETKSKLSPDLWFHPHNQFLSFWLSFGVVGLLLFLFILFYLPLYSAAFKNPFYWFFFLTVLFSFFVEDLLETQSGATYFAFFNAFFLMLWPVMERET